MQLLNKKIKWILKYSIHILTCVANMAFEVTQDLWSGFTLNNLKNMGG